MTKKRKEKIGQLPSTPTKDRNSSSPAPFLEQSILPNSLHPFNSTTRCSFCASNNCPYHPTSSFKIFPYFSFISTGLDDCIAKIDALHTPFRIQTAHFELVLFFYLVTHLLIQNFNVYRTSFYNYNFYLLFLTILILLRRCLSKYFKYLKRERENEITNFPNSSSVNYITIKPLDVEGFQTSFKKNLSAKHSHFNGCVCVSCQEGWSGKDFPEMNGIPLSNAFGGTDGGNGKFNSGFSSSFFHRHHRDSHGSDKHQEHNQPRIKLVKRSLFNTTGGSTGACLNLLIILLICINSTHLILQLFLRHPLKNFLFLFYPYIGSVFLFGVGGQKSKEAQQKKIFDALHEANTPTTIINPAERIVYRIKRILYNSFECGYFAGFLPLKFLQHDCLYYDPVRCTVLIVYVFINSLVMFSTRLLSTSFNELYSQSQLLGCWKKVPPSRVATLDLSTIEDWSQPTAINKYKKGALVKSNGNVYESITELNNAEPGCLLASLLYYLFENPERTHSLLIGFQGMVVLSQLALLFNTNNWNIYGLMLLFNYYIFYLCICTKRENLIYFPNYVPN